MDSVQSFDLTKIYTKGHEVIPALQGVSFSIRDGEFVSFVGRSGSGKSTLLNCIGGLDTPTSGRLLIKGSDLAAMRRSELARHRLNTVGMIFQSFNLIHTRTARENITLALAFSGMPRRQRGSKASEALSRVGLSGRENHRPNELSGGETQRVAIARAIINNPSILLADEPTGNLDSKTSEEIIGLLAGLNREKMTILMVSHDEDMAESVSHRVFRLLDGRIVDIKPGKGSR